MYIDPQLQLALDQLLAITPGGMNASPSLQGRRELIDQMLLALPKNENVSREDFHFHNYIDGAELLIRIYTPVNYHENDSLLLAIHGGGMVMGGVDTDDANSSRICEELSVKVAAIDYRLAPEHPFPAGLHDCYSAYRWLIDNAEILNISRNKIGVYGGSAGGGLALGTMLLLKARKEANFLFVMAPYPMIDQRNQTLSSHEVVDLGVWDRDANVESWHWYLGGDETRINEFSSPSLATNLSELPPIFIDVGTADLFRDEDIEFVQRLAKAGNQVEFHLYPGAFHASELFAPDADLSQVMWKRRFDVLRKWLR